MLSIAEIERQYQPRGVTLGEEILLEPNVAIEFTNSCQQNDLAVIGFDGFAFHNGEYTLLSDVIADFSKQLVIDLVGNETWEEYRTNCNKATIDLLHRFENREGLLVSLVAISRQTWESPNH